MRTFPWFFPFTLIILLIAGCGGEQTADESDTETVTEIETPAPDAPESSDTSASAEKAHPCDLITADYVKSIFKVDESTFTIDRSSDSYPNCSYRWKSDQKRTIKTGDREILVDKQCLVSVTFIDRPISQSMYDQSIASYPDKVEALQVGDEAVWSNERQQATVHIGQNLFHVHVNCSNNVGENKTKAIAISRKVLDEHFK